MPHDISLISTIAVSLVYALIGGYVATRLKLPPLVGYLLAGVVLGPHVPGFNADVHIASQLAEIGVMLLMFGVGMHFSVKDLMSVRGVALPGAIVQMCAATAIGALVSHAWGWTFGAGLVFGLAVSVASTVVLLRALESFDGVATRAGRIAVGWLIVEDLAMVLVLVLLPAFSEQLGGHAPEEAHAGVATHGALAGVAITLVKVAAFVAIMLFAGRRVFPWLLRQVARTNSRELFTLAVTAVALGVAFESAELFGVSYALGAFFAGLVLNESDSCRRATEDLLPIQNAASVLFFVAVGMLFDPMSLVRHPVHILETVGIIVVAKSLAAFGIAVACRCKPDTALMVAAGLAQIGEFSFILAGLGVHLGLLPEEGMHLILAGALISITLNPLFFRIARMYWYPDHEAEGTQAASGGH